MGWKESVRYSAGKVEREGRIYHLHTKTPSKASYDLKPYPGTDIRVRFESTDQPRSKGRKHAASNAEG